MHHYTHLASMEALRGLQTLSEAFLAEGDPTPCTTVLDYAYEQE